MGGHGQQSIAPTCVTLSRGGPCCEFILVQVTAPSFALRAFCVRGRKLISEDPTVPPGRKHEAWVSRTSSRQAVDLQVRRRREWSCWLSKWGEKQKAVKRLKTNPQHLPVRTLRAAACPRRGRDVGYVHMQVKDGASVFIGWRNTNDLSW